MATEDLVFELICDSCGEEYTISVYDKGSEEIPIHCPFCGQEIDVSDFEEDEVGPDDDDLKEDDEFETFSDDVWR